MSFNPGLQRFEYTLSMRPKPIIQSSGSETRPESNLLLGRSISSSGREIVIYEDDVEMGDDTEMRDPEPESSEENDTDGELEPSVENSGDETDEVKDVDENNDGEESAIEDDDGEDAIDEAAAETVSDDEEGVSELNSSSPEPDDSGEEQYVFVSADESTIYAPDIDDFIPMPTNPEEIKKVVMDVFLYCAPFDYLQGSCKINAEVALCHRFPNNLWWSHFSPGETFAIIDGQEKCFLRAILGRLSSVMARWKDIPGYPTIPESRIDIEVAKKEEQSLKRKDWFESLLRHRCQTDDWIMTIFEVFRPAGGFDGLTLGDLGLNRDRWATFAATLAEELFVHVDIARAELELVDSESVKSLIKDLVLAESGSTKSNYPELVRRGCSL